VNGCQTTKVLLENKRDVDDSIEVLIRVIVAKDASFAGKVSTYTNSQNPIKPVDLASRDPELQELERYLSTKVTPSFFFERKRGGRLVEHNKKQINKLKKEFLLIESEPGARGLLAFLGLPKESINLSADILFDRGERFYPTWTNLKNAEAMILAHLADRRLTDLMAEAPHENLCNA